jgi:hypothetical protein
MRAHRLLLQRSEKVVITIAQLCEERADNIQPPAPTPLFTGPSHLASLPAQVPYPVGSGSQSLRNNKEGIKARDRLSPPLSFFEDNRSSAPPEEKAKSTEEVKAPVPKASSRNGVSKSHPPTESQDKHNPEPSSANNQAPTHIQAPAPRPSSVVIPSLTPEHMAPKRAKWTSPPPPNADVSDVKLFENRFECGLEMATQSSSAREMRNHRHHHHHHHHHHHGGSGSEPSSSRYAPSEMSEEQLESDIDTNPDLEEDAYSDVGFLDSRSVVSFNGMEPINRQFSGAHSTGTRTPPLQVLQGLRREHLEHLAARSNSPPPNEQYHHPRLQPRHQWSNRPPRLLQTSRSGSQPFDRAVSDGEPEKGETSTRRVSRGDSLLPPLSTSVPHDRGVHHQVTTPRRNTQFPRNTTGNSPNTSRGYHPPPRIQARQHQQHQPGTFPITPLNPAATMAGYTIYQPFLTHTGAPVLPTTAFNAAYFPQAHFTATPESQRHLGIDTNSLSPHSSGSGHYSTQSSPLQPHPAADSPTTASAQQTDFQGLMQGLSGRSI